MRSNKIFFTLTAILLVLSCASGERAGDNIIDFKEFNVTQKKYTHFTEAGKITKAIKLETTSDSLLALIDRVIVDPQTGDLIIGDFRKAKRVLRFSSQGRFIRGYGTPGNGPGEYHHMRDLTVTSNGDVILLTATKMLRYDKTGKFLKESRLDFYAGDIECIDDLLYIPVLRYRRDPGDKKAIVTLTPAFEQTGGVGVFDTRLEKLIYSAHKATASIGKSLYFIDNYEFNLNIYDTETRKTIRLPIPNNNAVLDKIWSKKRISQADKKEIHTHLHHFISIMSVEDRLMLIESHRASKIHRGWLLNLNKKEVHMFNLSCLYGDYRVEDKPDLFFHRIFGTFDKRIIGDFNNTEIFNRYKHKYPLLKDIQFMPEDNPILVFFEFHEDK